MRDCGRAREAWVIRSVREKKALSTSNCHLPIWAVYRSTTATVSAYLCDPDQRITTILRVKLTASGTLPKRPHVLDATNLFHGLGEQWLRPGSLAGAGSHLPSWQRTNDAET